jgi:hypothetical protein
MFKLVGYEEKKGTLPVDEKTGEVKEYHNYDLHFLTDEKTDEKNGVFGLTTFSGKARAADLKLTGAKELKELFGKEVYPITDLTARKDEEGKVRQMIIRLVAV